MECEERGRSAGDGRDVGCRGNVEERLVLSCMVLRGIMWMN